MRFYRAGVTHSVGPLDLALCYELHHTVDGVSVERRHPRVELVKDDAQGPEVSSLVIWLALHHFRRHVQWGTFEGGQHHGGGTHGSGKSAERLNHVVDHWKMI